MREDVRYQCGFPNSRRARDHETLPIPDGTLKTARFAVAADKDLRPEHEDSS